MQKGNQARVLFSVGNKIYETNLDGNNLRLVIDNKDFRISSFDFNFAKNTFYFTDEKNSKVYIYTCFSPITISIMIIRIQIKFLIDWNKIYRGRYESNGVLQISPFITTNIGGPLYLAVDWVTENIYLAQTLYSRLDIFSPDGSNRTSLINSDIYTPSSLALDPSESVIFFTDNGNMRNLKLQGPKIERAFMDGSGRKVSEILACLVKRCFLFLI